MGAKIDYQVFLNELDSELDSYFKCFGENICCKKGCSACCEKGDYPISNIELEYLMQGYAELSYDEKTQVQKNINVMINGGACPFLINSECSVYKYRPIICRVHGLAYLMDNGVVKVPYCANEGKNFSKVYSKGEFLTEPIKKNLNTFKILTSVFPKEKLVIKNMYDWIKG